MEGSATHKILMEPFFKYTVMRVLICLIIWISGGIIGNNLCGLTTPVHCAIIIILLILLGVLITIYQIREIQTAKRTSEILENIYADDSTFLLEENLNCGNLYERVNIALSSLSNQEHSEYESTLMTQQAELFALQAQINPHFLYNTLDSIRGQAVIDGADEIAETIEALSNIFKYSISQKDNLISLRQEIDNLKYYMKIQKYRYMDRINLELEIDAPELLKAKVPRLTLQPIIENAIYHGLEPKIGKGTVKMKVFATGNQLRIIISDDGVGMDDFTLLQIKRSLCDPVGNKYQNASHGIALYNTNRRIQQYFGNTYGLDVFSTKMLGTRVELLFPYRKEGTNDAGSTAPM